MLEKIEKMGKETIDGIESRLLSINGEPYICIADMYNHLTIDPRTARGIISRNEDQFAKYMIKFNGSDLQFISSQPSFNIELGFQKGTMYNFLSETGYNLFVQKIDPETIKDDLKRDIVMNRQRGMAEVFTKYRRKELVSAVNVTPVIHPSMRSPEQVCKDKIDLGIYIADIVNVPKTMMIAVALAEATRETGVSFEKYQKCLPPAENEYEGAHISARDLGKPYGDDGRKINKLLQYLGYITKENNAWKLTKFGEDFGGAYFHYTSENSGHSGIYIQWPAKMREIIKRNESHFPK